jgi:hypothetical protein
MVKRMLRHLPVTMLTKLGLATLVAPSTSSWSGARAAIERIRPRAGAKHRKRSGSTD